MKGGGDEKLEMPPGFRFHPTDQELVTHYLCRKCAGQPIAVPIIAEIDLYKFDPWQLPGMALYGEREWYFFSPRDRKYPNGSRPNRAAGTGYWKATGADKPVGKPKPTGIKKALVFYTGKAPKGIKTNWIMHEYRLANVDRSAAANRKNLRLDDWVLCRIYNKKGIIEKRSAADDHNNQSMKLFEDEEQKPKLTTFPHNQMAPPPAPAAGAASMPLSKVMTNEYGHFDTYFESAPRLTHTESSGSGEDQVLSSLEFNNSDYKEVQSAPKWDDMDIRGALDHQLNYVDGFQDDPFASHNGMQYNYNNQFFTLQDMFTYMQKPF